MEERLYIQDHTFQIGPDKKFDNFDYWVEMISDDEFEGWVRGIEDSHQMPEDDPGVVEFDEYLGMTALALWSHENEGERYIESNEKLNEIVAIFIHNMSIAAARRLGYIKTLEPLSMNRIAETTLTEKGELYRQEQEENEKFKRMKNLILLLSVIWTCTSFAQVFPYKSDINDQFIEHRGFTMSYNEACEQPNWVFYTITKADLQKDSYERKNDFRSDPSVPTESAHKNDYKKSGYDRGHLASAADFSHNDTLLSETFYMSNMSPQLPGFNRGVWKKLETHVRSLAIQYDTLYVITAGILTGEMDSIGENKVCIPSYYYKVLYAKELGVVCYLLPHEKSSKDLDEFIVPISSIEELTGLRFFVNY
jgi:endonuclease G